MFVFSLGCIAQTPKKYATARVIEGSQKEVSRITLTYETGETELIQLSALKFLQPSSTNENLLENQKLITKMINDMVAKGYTISKMSSSGEGFINTWILFEKTGE